MKREGTDTSTAGAGPVRTGSARAAAPAGAHRFPGKDGDDTVLHDDTALQGGVPSDGVAPESVGAQSAAGLGGRSLLGLVAVVVGAVPFLALLALVESRWPPLRSLDTALVDGLNAAVASSPLSVRALSILTEAGGGATAGFVLAVAVVCLLIRRRHRLAAYVAVTALGLAVLVPVTKVLVGRERPEVALPVVELPTNASFPSGHAMTAMVTWGVLLLVVLPGLHPRARRAWTAAAALLVLLIGFTRIALGVHFLTDVVAGWALGVAWLAVVTIAFRRWLHARGEVVSPVGAGVATGGVSDGTHGALPDGRRTLLPLVLGWVPVVVAVTALGLVLTRLLGSGPVARADHAALTALVDLRSPALTAAVDVVGSLAGLWGVAMATLAGAAVAAAYDRSWRPVVFMVAAVVGEVLLYGAVAAVVGRGRPDVPDLTAALPTGASFPSGHAAAATVVYGGIAVLVVASFRAWWRWVSVGLAVLVVVATGFARVYVAAHYPSDVVGGVLLGCLWLVVLHRALLDSGARPGPGTAGGGAHAAGSAEPAVAPRPGRSGSRPREDLP